LPVIIFSLALWTLDEQLQHLRSSYIVQNIASVPLRHIGIAVFLTFLSYVALTGYDYLATRALRCLVLVEINSTVET
jgi:phosphatidylglycerol lysyltransferase